MAKSLPKWNEERFETLVGIVGANSGAEVSITSVEEAAVALETTNRSIASKLRKAGYTVQSAATSAVKKYTDAEEEELKAFVEGNSGVYTYGEIAAAVLSGEKSTKAIQGKLLSMELTGHVKPTPKQEAAKAYTDAEESTVISLANAGGTLEAISAAVGKSLNSVRGKCLSLVQKQTKDGAGGIAAIPKQEQSYAKAKEDGINALGDNITTMTVAEIAEAVDKTALGVKNILTHRGINCADWQGADRKAKNDAKKATTEAA